MSESTIPAEIEHDTEIGTPAEGPYRHSNRATASWLGYLGLTPFIVFTAGSLMPEPVAVISVEMITLYAAIILSFMGAVHWGAALVNDQNVAAHHYIISIIPALAAWLALLVVTPLSLALLAVSFVSLYRYDRIASGLLGFSDWYIPLRLRLTMIVSTCLTLSLLAHLFIN